MEILNPAQRDQLDRRIQKIDPDDKFIESILPVFGKAESQAAKSKKYYFLIETMILVFTMLAGVFSGIASADVLSDQIGTIIGLISMGLSLLITALIGIRGLRLWRETWLRHRSCVNEFRLQSYHYANYLGIYQKPAENQNEDEAAQYEREMLKTYKQNVLDALDKTNTEFLANMKQHSGSTEK